MHIRQETANDYSSVHSVIEQAFASAEHSDGNEADLVSALRKGKSFIPKLSLVAEIDGKIVGHILFTKVMVGNSIQLALAPVSVDPAFQKRGIGSLLINSGHTIAKRMGFEYSIVLGYPKYYSRFGYKPSIEFNIICPFDVPEDFFMAINLQEKKSLLNAKVEYPKEFLITECS